MTYARLPKPIKRGTGRAGVAPFPAAWDHEHPFSGSTGGGTTIHAGYGPPTSGIGQPGDFYLDQASDILYGPKGAGESFGPANYAFAAKTPTSNVSASPGYVIGNRFHLNTGGRVTALRFWKAATTTTTHTIKLWRVSDETQLGQSVPTTEVSGATGWIEGAMVTPVDVVAGIDVMVSLDLAQTYSYIDSITASETPHFSLVAGHYGVTLGGYPPNGRAFNHFTDMALCLSLGSTVWPIAMDPSGEGGGAVQGYTHTQAVASATWVIDHPLAFRPNVTAVDSAGEQVEGEVDYTDSNTVTIKFAVAFGGTAYLS